MEMGFAEITPPDKAPNLHCDYDTGTLTKAADAALLVSVPQVEIVIASCFESGVEVPAKR